MVVTVSFKYNDEVDPWMPGSYARMLLNNRLLPSVDDTRAIVKELDRLAWIEEKVRRAISTGSTADWRAVHQALELDLVTMERRES